MSDSSADDMAQTTTRSWCDRPAPRTPRTGPRNGRPAAVLVSPADLASLEETLDVLPDADSVAGLAQADKALAAGDSVADAVRALRRRG